MRVHQGQVVGDARPVRALKAHAATELVHGDRPGQGTSNTATRRWPAVSAPTYPAPVPCTPTEHVPRDRTSPWWGEHVARYRFAAPLCRGVHLDIACGSGLGFDHLDGVDLIVAGDLNAAAVAEAAAAPSAAQIALARLDVTTLPFRSRTFDSVTCMETVEHVNDDAALVAELARVLRDAGTAIVSTPNVEVTGDRSGCSKNPFHIREYRSAEFVRLLEESFASVDVVGQTTTVERGVSAFFAPQRGLLGALGALGSKIALRTPTPPRRALEWITRRSIFPLVDDWRFLDDVGPETHVLVAVCRDPRRSG